MVDCNDELTDALGNRMSHEEFSEKYNSILEDYTRDSLNEQGNEDASNGCLLYTSPSPRDATLSRMPSSA